jgi:hypothetical protein
MFAVFLTLALSVPDYGDQGANWEKVEKDEFLDIKGVAHNNWICYLSHTKEFTAMPRCGLAGTASEHSDSASIIDGAVQCTAAPGICTAAQGCTAAQETAQHPHEILLKVTNLKQRFLNVQECSAADAYVGTGGVSLEFETHSTMAVYFLWIFVVLTALLTLLIIAAYFHSKGKFNMAENVLIWCAEHRWIVLAILVASAVIAAVLSPSGIDDDDNNAEVVIIVMSGLAIVLSVFLTMRMGGDDAGFSIGSAGTAGSTGEKAGMLRAPSVSGRPMRVLQTRV